VKRVHQTAKESTRFVDGDDHDDAKQGKLCLVLSLTTSTGVQKGLARRTNKIKGTQFR